MTQQAPSPDLWRPSPVMVEMLHRSAPVLDPDRIAALAADRAGVPAEVATRGDHTFGIAFPEQRVTFTDASVPMTVWIMRAGDDRGPDQSSVEERLQQTWGWDEAEAAVRSAPVATLVTDIMAGPLDHRIRLRLFHAVLASVVAETAPAALSFMIAQRYVDPAAYLADVAADPLAFASTVNVRYVTVADRPDEQLMDTLGMKPFALPDIQLHFTSLEPGWVAGKLLGIARYVFDNGDIIEDGNTVPGTTDDERWRCHHEFALLGPEREVLDIDPGPYGPRRA